MNNQSEQINLWVDELMQNQPILLKKIDLIPNTTNISSKDLLIEMIRFLYLVSYQNKVLSPSFLVDLAWHEFILFTRAYEQFCNQKLGRFIHHTPDDNTASNHRNFLKTIQLYITIFGEPNPDVWGDLAKQEWKDIQCGSCESN